MTRKALAFVCFALASLASGSTAQAAYCFSEKINQFVLVGDAIYFTTDKSCPTWCQVPTTWSPDARNRAYSLLLTAKTTKVPVSFNWPTASTGCAALPVYSAFDQIFLAE